MIRPIHRRPSSTPVRACVCVCVSAFAPRARSTWDRSVAVAVNLVKFPVARRRRRRRHCRSAVYTTPPLPRPPPPLADRLHRRRRHEIPNVIGRPEFTIKTATKNYRHRLPFENEKIADTTHRSKRIRRRRTLDGPLIVFRLLSYCRRKHGRDTIHKIT